MLLTINRGSSGRCVRKESKCSWTCLMFALVSQFVQSQPQYLSPCCTFHTWQKAGKILNIIIADDFVLLNKHYMDSIKNISINQVNAEKNMKWILNVSSYGQFNCSCCSTQTMTKMQQQERSKERERPKEKDRLKEKEVKGGESIKILRCFGTVGSPSSHQFPAPCPLSVQSVGISTSHHNNNAPQQRLAGDQMIASTV